MIKGRLIYTLTALSGLMAFLALLGGGFVDGG
jgi:hypothetical protein